MNGLERVLIASSYALLAACGAAGDDELRAAVPTAAELRVEPPPMETPSAYWAMSQQLAALMGDLVGAPLRVVDAITAHPPTASDGRHAVWAPGPDPRSPVEHRLVVARAGGDAFDFQLLVKARGAGDDTFRPFLAGASRLAGGRRGGALAIDFGLLHGLDPHGQPDGGRVTARFDVGDDANVEVNIDEAGREPTSAQGFLHRAARGGGAVELHALSQFAPGPARENAQVVARWSPARAGRAEVKVRGGDAGAGADSVECWDERARRVFFAAMPVGGQPAAEGDPAACLP